MRWYRQGQRGALRHACASVASLRERLAEAEEAGEDEEEEEADEEEDSGGEQSEWQLRGVGTTMFLR